MILSMRKSDLEKARKILASEGGKASAKKRRETMTPEQRSQRARRIINARWHPERAATGTATP